MKSLRIVSVLALLTLPLPAFGQTPNPALARPLRVMDSQNAVLGSYQSSSTAGSLRYVVVLRREVNGAVALFPAGEDDPYALGGSFLHQSNNCSGPRLFVDTGLVSPGVLLRDPLSGAGQLWYAGGAKVFVPFASGETPGNGPGSCGSPPNFLLANGYCCSVFNPGFSQALREAVQSPAPQFAGPLKLN